MPPPLKLNPNYPDTSRLGPETPIGVIVRKVDKNFDKDRRRELAYDYGRAHPNARNFYVDPYTSGPYTPAPPYAFDSSFDESFDSFEASTLEDNGFGDT